MSRGEKQENSCSRISLLWNSEQMWPCLDPSSAEAIFHFSGARISPFVMISDLSSAICSTLLSKLPRASYSTWQSCYSFYRKLDPRSPLSGALPIPESNWKLSTRCWTLTMELLHHTIFISYFPLLLKSFFSSGPLSAHSPWVFKLQEAIILFMLIWPIWNTIFPSSKRELSSQPFCVM